MKNAQRKIGVVTGTRAEYGLLVPLLREITADPTLALQLYVTGMHLSPEFGSTVREIAVDGFTVTAEVPIFDAGDDSRLGAAKATGRAVSGLADAFSKHAPDLVVVLGDRFEIAGAAMAATLLGIPIAHIAGGEVTEGAFDDVLRHAVTKMAHLHFVTTEDYRRRLLQLGEDEARVFNFGSLSIDNVLTTTFMSRDALEKDLGFRFGSRSVLTTFHPVTREHGDSLRQLDELLTVLAELPDTSVLVTLPNADPEGRLLGAHIQRFCDRHAGRMKAFPSLGRVRYLSALKIVDALVGNSSSGIIEAPSFKIGTINIGNRQKGRVQADSVVNCEAERGAIRAALAKLFSEPFQARLKTVKNPYGSGLAAPRMKDVLKAADLASLGAKPFVDRRSTAE